MDKLPDIVAGFIGLAIVAVTVMAVIKLGMVWFG